MQTKTGKKQTSTVEKTTARNATTKSKNGIALWLVTIVIFAAAVGVLQKQIYDLKQEQLSFKQEQNQNITELKKIYVYDLEETLRGLKLDSMNREFEAKINILNDEVSAAQKKIASLKETKDKDDFSDVYLKSLKLKRDSMLQEYNRTIENLTEDINRTVTEIATEKGASAVFDMRAVATRSDNVEDVTGEVIKRVKLVRPKILDE